jgi:hypothetical protein
VFRRLALHEWAHEYIGSVAVHRDARILGLDPAIREPLYQFYQSSDGEPEALEIAQRVTAPILELRTVQEQLGWTDWYLYDATLRVMERDPRPGRAGEWWRQVEERMLALRDPSWALDVIQKLLGAEGSAGVS